MKTKTTGPRSASASGGGGWLKPVIGVGAVVGVLLAGYLASGKLLTAKPSGTANATAVVAQMPWVAAASGRVEPRSGEIKVGTGLLGRVAEVLVRVDDKVEEGELLLRLDDEEPRARLAAAEAEAGARRNERDSQPAAAGREEIRRVEDAVFAAERAVTGARYELDGALASRRNGNGSEQAVTDARRRLNDATQRLTQQRIAFANAQSKPGLPTPNRFESALNTARAEVAIAQTLLDKTRIRAPIPGTVLQVHAKPGETVAPAPDAPLLVLGDMSVMRVKAELDDADVAKVKVGQKAFVKTPSYPDKEFEGRVTRLAPTLAPPRIGQRGPRRPTDVEVQEVTIELDGTPTLLPGMRVDAFFRR